MILKTSAAILSAPLILAACMSTSDQLGPDSTAWSGYKNWYKATAEPNTGDPTGFLGNRHEGLNAYRDIYVNSVGESVNRGQQEFPYPEGTVIVKESFNNLDAYEAQRNPELTIMVKLAQNTSPQTADWEYIVGAEGSRRGSGESGQAVFCHSCHSFAAETDFSFINSRFEP